jgi:hypothetical protein
MKYTISLIVIIVLQPLLLHAQRVESGTGYWYDGIVTHKGGIARVISNEPRPLRQAVESLSKEYGWIVDYEDPVYSDAEAVDRKMDPVWVASHPGVRQRLVAGRSFESEFPEDAKIGSSVTEEKSVLQKVVSDYNKSGNPGQFTLVDEGGGRFAIVGQANGTAQTIFDTPITVNIDQLNVSFALDAICQALTSASGANVILLKYPLNLAVQTIVSTRASNQPAREVLRTVADAGRRKLEWTLLYDVDDKTYGLNLDPVVKATASITGGKTPELGH